MFQTRPQRLSRGRSQVGAGSVKEDEERIASGTTATATEIAAETAAATVEVETEHAGDDDEELADEEDQRVYFGRKVHPQTDTRTHVNARTRTYT